MTTENKTSTRLSKEQPSKTRMILGSIILITGFLSPLLIPSVVASEMSSGLKSVIAGLLAFGIPEIFMLIAVAVFGKAGFNYFKRYISLVIKVYGPSDEVSLLRYRIGLILFSIPLLVSLVLPYVIFKIEVLTQNLLPLTIGLHAMLIISLFVLGGNFWDKLRGLFMHQAIAVLKSKNHD